MKRRPHKVAEDLPGVRVYGRSEIPEVNHMLKDLLAQELITEKEYARAKKYYMKLTGADIVLAR